MDVGTRRVGLAIADPLRIFAQPVGTYAPDEALRVLRRIDKDDGLALAVVGWPLTEDGQEGEATQMVNGYIRRIRKAVRSIRIHRQDERYTSEEAKARLEGRVTKGRVDTMAAGIILQEYLDSGGVRAGNVSER